VQAPYAHGERSANTLLAIGSFKADAAYLHGGAGVTSIADWTGEAVSFTTISTEPTISFESLDASEGCSPMVDGRYRRKIVAMAGRTGVIAILDSMGGPASYMYSTRDWGSDPEAIVAPIENGASVFFIAVTQTVRIPRSLRIIKQDNSAGA